MVMIIASNGFVKCSLRECRVDVAEACKFQRKRLSGGGPYFLQMRIDQIVEAFGKDVLVMRKNL